MAIVTQEYVEIDEKGVARVAGSRSKVSMIATDHIYLGMTPSQIHEEYPHLSLAQIHAALAYYFDHRAEIDAQIEESKRLYEQLKAKADASPTPVVQRLRELKKRLP